MRTSWKSVSKIILAVWVISAFAFWIHALTSDSGFLLLDFINLPFHEFGHLFFGILGEGIGIWGGTIFQLLIPVIIFVNFYLRREPSGVTFSAFWFGENLLNISWYIADVRKMALPLVGGGEHDWNTILSGLGMLKYDTTIAVIVKTFGWLIMIAAVGWLVIASLKNKPENEA